MKSGDLYLVNLDPTVGSEIRKTRPVVVLNPGHGKNLPLALVVPVTGWQMRWEQHPFFLTIEPQPHHGLTKKSAVDCFQIRALSHQRFIRRLGEIGRSEMEEIKAAVALILDIEPQHCS